MPLSKTGKKILQNFQKKYGKDRGKSIFYAWEARQKFVKK